MFDEEGDQFVEMKMEVDDINYPLDDVTNFNQYSDLKPPEKMQQDKKEVPEEDLSSSEKKKASNKKTYRNYKKEDMEELFYLVNEKRMSIRAAAAEIKVPSTTAYNWHKKGLESLELDEDTEKGGPSAWVCNRNMQDQFEGSTFSFNRAKQPSENRRKIPMDEIAFHINLKRSMAWSKKEERAVVVTPKTRAKITTIIGAISPYGVVNIKVKSPKLAGPSKKRKAASGGSVVVGKHELFKERYLVMDNAPIHKHTDIKSYIESRGYGCVYLLPYSPELNPIEQFWSVCKSKLKREALLEEETLTSRIKFACNNLSSLTV
ncbi:hypothetical protein G6F62_009199 [Rhizopus arrhizus]|nr:hypothetical protein G6F62_009199 [Rhizopus arrhizus]